MTQQAAGGQQAVGGSTLLGANPLQQSLDSLKTTIDRLNQGISELGAQIHQSNRLSMAGGGGGGAGGYASGLYWGNNGGHGSRGGQQRNANGGGANFGGGGGGGGAGGGTGQGGGGQAGGGQGGGNLLQRVTQTAGGKAGIVAGTAMLVNAGMNRLIQQSGSDITTADLVASQLSIGGANTRQAVENSMKGNVTGLNMADVAQGRYTLTRGLGIGVNSATDQRMQAAMGITGAINPGMGNAQVAQAAQALNAPDMTVRMRGLGIGVGMGPGQHQDPLTVANQILQKIGNWQSINTPEKIQQHVDDPNGVVASTIRNWVAHGFLPAESADVVKEDIRAILVARMTNGTDFQKLQRLGQQYQSSNRTERRAAEKQLKAAGVRPDSIVQSDKDKASSKRDRSLDMTDDFAKGAEAATGALTLFTDAINRFLQLDVIKQVVGYGSGFKAGWNAGGGSDSDIGAMGNQAAFGFGGQPDGNMGNSSQGTPSTSLGSGSNKPSGAPGTQSGSGKSTASGRRSIKFIKPIAGQITSGFGMRNDPKNGNRKLHTGIDFGASVGTPIHASAAGRVIFSGSGGGRSWAGNYVMIDHGGGYATLYAHQSRPSARVGSTVQQGQVIGYSGQTGRATGPHLHFEVHINGRPVDPAPYLSGAGVSVSGDPTSPTATSTTSSTASASTSTEVSSGTSSSGSSSSSGSGNSGFGGIITSELVALMSFGGSRGNTGTAGSDTSANTSSSSSTNADSGSSSTPTAPSSVSGNKAIVKEMAAARGWTGKQWDALYQLVDHESGFIIQKNPTSSAYGLFQFLDGTWKAYGPKTDDPRKQTEYGLKYIADRYGDPIKAWAFWQHPSDWDKKHAHWYDTGAWSIDRDQNAVVHKGEMIIPAKEARQIREVLLNGSAYGATKPGRQGGTGGGLQINIEKGAITVTTSGGVTSAGVSDLGKAIADAFAQHEKIKRLQEGVLT